MSEFVIDEVTRGHWERTEQAAATESELAELRTLASDELPEDYIAFLRRYGFATWPEAGARTYRFPGGTGTLAGISRPQRVERARASLLEPGSWFPFAADVDGHALLLFQLGGPAGVWFLYDDDPPIRIAASFSRFLASLHAYAKPVHERWRGTLREDPVTGFTIAEETRASWEEYGVGASPEPEAELRAIEAKLARPLPEALRSFLTRHGHVTFFGAEPIAEFALPRGRDWISVIYSSTVLARRACEDMEELPFATTARDAELLIGLGEDDEGVIYWSNGCAPKRVADDLRTLLASLFLEREVSP